MLYRCVQEYFETWLAQRRDGHDDDGSVPEYIEREFRRYLECGVLAHGFARARCGDCGHDFLISFSGKGRGVCPSCNARRMVETAAHLTDHVFPRLPVRQWVLVPKRLRCFLHRDADLQGAALQVFLRAVEQCLRTHSPGSGSSARFGAVAFIHRFGSTLNVHLHFHCVVIDGVFDSAAAGGVIFHAATGLDAPAFAEVQQCVRRRLLRVFVRRGLLAGDDARAMAHWEHDGGFSVDASVRIEAADRAGRERLLRYRARPPFAMERLRELDGEHLLYESTKPGPIGTGAALILTPLSCSTASPLSCRHRASTATATSACWRLTHPGVLRLPPSPWQQRPRRPHYRPTHPPPNRPTAAPPAMPGRGCSPASMKCSHSCVRPVAARCASSRSSPTPPPCAPSSPTSVSRRHHPESHPPAARHCGRRPMLRRIRHPIRRSSLPRPTSDQRLTW